jgi:DNA-binding transcriptional MerR regulator
MAIPAPAKLARVPSPNAGERMPIEELARRTAVTVRNLRALQSLGLLDPPELQGRKGFYTPAHLARVRLVLRLQARGFALASIRQLIEQWSKGGGLMDLAGIQDALLTPVSDVGRASAPLRQVMPELAENPRLLQRALELELCTRQESGEIVAPSAELLRIVRELASAGIPIALLLDELATLRADMDRIADRFRVLFRAHVDKKYRGAKRRQRDGFTDAIRRLPAGSVRVVTILLAQAIERGGPIPSPSKRTRTRARR